MEKQEIIRIFEDFFQKFRKSEDDDNTCTAFWTNRTPQGNVEISMTRCPADTTFKFFINGQKVNQVKEWEAFFPALDEFEKKHKDIFDRNAFFQAMQEMI